MTGEGRVLADRVEVTVTDDGCGFDPDAERGFGISQSITARLQEVGGGALIRSRPGRGTTVAARVHR